MLDYHASMKEKLTETRQNKIMLNLMFSELSVMFNVMLTWECLTNIFEFDDCKWTVFMHRLRDGEA
jgi:hypothetical protein